MDEKILLKIKKRMKLKEVEIASSPWKLALGLMFRKPLPKGKGMLFNFHYSDRHGIWMPFMRFRIDIHFFDKSGNLVGVARNAGPLSILRPSTWKIYRPGKPCRYAVETTNRT
jgi:uncharacterized membrane protein (UPF0127 family)